MRYVIFVILLFSFGHTYAQTEQVLFDRISVDEGLPEGNVLSFIQDSSGYIWVGSYEGLYKHNGSKLLPANQGANQTSLTTTRISKLGLDRDGHIWVGTYAGLNKIDRRTGAITQYLNVGDREVLPGNRVHSIYADSDNTVWISTDKGPAKYNSSADSFEAFKLPDNLFVYCFFEYNRKLILGTRKGVYELDKETFDAVPVKVNRLQDSVGKVVNIYQDNVGKVWLCTSTGLWEYNADERTVSKAVFMPERYSSHSVKHIVQDKKGDYWVSVHDNLIHVQMALSQSVVLNTDNSASKSILSKVIHVLFEDNSGNIWIGTDLGVNKINVISSNLKFYQLFPELERNNYKNHIQRVHQLPDGGMLYYTYSYLYYAEEIGGAFVAIKNAPPVFIDDITTMPKGDVWLCYTQPGKGIWKYVPEKRSIEQVQISDEIDKASVYEIDVDLDSSWIYWIGSSKGLCKYNSKTKKAELLQFEKSASRPYPLIKRFLQSRSGNIYMSAGSSVLLSYNKKTGEVRELSKNSKTQNQLFGIRDLLQTPDGTIWIATEVGLAKFDEETEDIKFFTTQNGLRGGDIVYTFLLDTKGSVWMTTFNHIISLDPVTEKFRYYSTSDGVNTSFNRWSSCMLNDGSLAFGGNNGLVVFHPDSLKYSSLQPKVIISSIKVNSKPYDSEILPEEQETIEVSFADKVVSFEFKALGYTDETRNDYAYKLDGFNEDWAYVGNENKVTYTNLSPGTYTFIVKATNYNGVWSDKTASVKLNVTPLFWQQWWFRFLVLILIIALLYYIWKSNKDRARLKQQKEIAEQNDQYKTQFLSNVSHEIRTPLNAIIGLNKLLSDTPLTTQQHKYVHAASQSSESLYTLINDLLDQAKIESGKFKFVSRSFNPSEVLLQVHDTFIHKAKEKELKLTLFVDEAVPRMVSGDSVRLHQVLSNLVSNAIKFTNKGDVSINMSSQSVNDGMVSICFEVKDTGVGIQAAMLDKIFDSFQQLEDGMHQNDIGTGLGLSICKQLIEQQGGDIIVESEYGKGSVFKFCIPYSNVGFSPVLVEPQKEKEVVLSGLKVLLVEDTPFNQLLAVEILKKNIKDIVVIVAENGKEALEVLEADNSFDIVLMDVKMPVMNGYETTKAIRAMSGVFYKTVPVIALTANAVAEELAKCREFGMNDWVTKPIDDKLLLKKIAHLVKRIK